MKRQDLEKELEVVLNNLRDIKSNKLKAQSIVMALESLGLLLKKEPKHSHMQDEPISQRRDN